MKIAAFLLLVLMITPCFGEIRAATQPSDAATEIADLKATIKRQAAQIDKLVARVRSMIADRPTAPIASAKLPPPAYIGESLKSYRIRISSFKGVVLNPEAAGYWRMWTPNTARFDGQNTDPTRVENTMWVDRASGIVFDITEVVRADEGGIIWSVSYNTEAQKIEGVHWVQPYNP